MRLETNLERIQGENKKRGFGKVISCETLKGFELRRRMIFPLYLKKFEMDQKGI
jgi:hypothetical protein